MCIKCVLKYKKKISVKYILCFLLVISIIKLLSDSIKLKTIMFNNGNAMMLLSLQKLFLFFVACS